MDLKILDISLLKEFRSAVRESPFEKADRIAKPDTPIDYFEFLLMTVSGIDEQA